MHHSQEACVSMKTAAPVRRRLNFLMHDIEPGCDTYVERPGYCLNADLRISEVATGDYDIILLFGGRAPEYLRNHVALLEIVRDFDPGGKWVLAVFHGIQILVTAG